MARKHSPAAVRPLGPQPRQPAGRRPAKLIAFALFVVGAAAGYLIGQPGDPSASVEPEQAAAVGAGSSVVDVTEYSWTRQTSPEFTPRLWAVHTAIEVDGYIYALITDDIQNRVSRALWRTANGAEWEQVSLDLGPGSVATDLDIRGEQLVVSGWDESRPTIWTTSIHHDITQLTWRPTHLDDGELPIGQLVPVFSEVRTEINSAGEHVVVAAMQYAIERDEVLPVGPNRPGGELSEIAIHGSQIWARTVSAAGQEAVEVVPIPEPITVQPISGRVGSRVTELSAWTMWVSPDGDSFVPIEPIRGLDVAPTVSAFNDGFIASTLTLDTSTYQILTSADGAAWRPVAGPVPEQCGSSRPGVVGAEMLLVAGDDFTHTCTPRDGVSWQVHETPQTAVSDNAFLWITGNEQGFLAFAINSEERAVLESADGIAWQRIGLEPSMAIGGAYLAGERMLNVARTGGRQTPQPWTMWVGQRLEG